MKQYYYHVTCFRDVCGVSEWLGFVVCIHAEDSNESCMQINDLICSEYPGWSFSYCVIGKLAFEQQRKIDYRWEKELRAMKVAEGAFA